MKTLEIPSNIINRIVNLYQGFQANLENSDVQSSGSASERVIDYARNPYRGEMHRLINDLSLEQKKELSAIVWLGRGDYDSFEDAMENADSVVGDGQGTAGYLEGTDLAANISRGIDKLKAEDISLI